MKLTLNPYDKGKSAYNNGRERKPTNDGAFMQELENVDHGNDTRKIKSALIKEWKDGWDAGRKEGNE